MSGMECTLCKAILNIVNSDAMVTAIIRIAGLYKYAAYFI